MSNQHAFCQCLLKATLNDVPAGIAADVRAAGVTFSQLGFNKHYVVQARGGRILWEGRADCAYEARSKAANALNREHFEVES